MKGLKDVALLVVLLAYSVPLVHAFVVHSEGSGGWATGMVTDNDQVYIVGVTFASEFWGTTRTTPVGCFLSAGTPHNEDEEFITTRLGTPQYCMGGVTLVDSQQAFLTGISFLDDPQTDNQNGLHTMRLQNNRPITDGSHSLPSDTVSVAVSYHDEASDPVMVGLHDTNGHTLSGTETTLSEIVEFWLRATTPDETLTEIPGPPQIVSVNPTTGIVKVVMNLLTADKDTNTHISALQLTPEFLIVAGSTNTQVDGSNFCEDPSTSWPEPVLGDWDGFVSFINPSTGELDRTLYRNSYRIAASGHKRDEVVDICLYENELYVVGVTTGDLDAEEGGTFLLKIELTYQGMEWQSDISLDGVKGNKCVAGSDGVYVAGTTSVHVSDDSSSYGSDTSTMDAFVAKFNRTSGDTMWIQQLDTSNAQSNSDPRDDYVVDVDVNHLGNVNLLFNSMNLAKNVNDVYLVELDAITGEYDALHDRKSLSDEILEDKNFVPLVVASGIALAVLVLVVVSCVTRRPRRHKLDFLETDGILKQTGTADTEEEEIVCYKDSPDSTVEKEVELL